MQGVNFFVKNENSGLLPNYRPHPVLISFFLVKVDAMTKSLLQFLVPTAVFHLPLNSCSDTQTWG